MCTIMHTDGSRFLTVLKTVEFDRWMDCLPIKTRLIVTARLDLLALGHLGDHRRFDGLLELRWKNGHRVYGFFWGERFVVALVGGNKNGQQRDIKKAKRIRDEIIKGSRSVQQS